MGRAAGRIGYRSTNRDPPTNDGGWQQSVARWPQPMDILVGAALPL